MEKCNKSSLNNDLNKQLIKKSNLVYYQFMKTIINFYCLIAIQKHFVTQMHKEHIKNKLNRN